jgi:hypothetical protein
LPRSGDSGRTLGLEQMTCPRNRPPVASTTVHSTAARGSASEVRADLRSNPLEPSLEVPSPRVCVTQEGLVNKPFAGSLTFFGGREARLQKVSSPHRASPCRDHGRLAPADPATERSRRIHSPAQRC